MSVFIFARMLIVIFVCTFIWDKAGWVAACFAFVLYLWKETKCKQADCCFCQDRPDKPSEVNK